MGVGEGEGEKTMVVGALVEVGGSGTVSQMVKSAAEQETDSDGSPTQGAPLPSSLVRVRVT